MTIIFDPIDIYANQFSKMFTSVVCRLLAHKNPEWRTRDGWLCMVMCRGRKMEVKNNRLPVEWKFVQWKRNDFQSTEPIDQTNFGDFDFQFLARKTIDNNKKTAERERERDRRRSLVHVAVTERHFSMGFRHTMKLFHFGLAFSVVFTLTHVTGGHN